MTHKLIHTPDYLLVVDDSEIKEGDWVYDVYDGIVRVEHKYQLSNIMVFRKDCQKIIAHLPLNDSPILKGVDLLPPLEQEDDAWKHLLKDELDKLPYSKHLDDGQYNDGQIVGFEFGAEWAYNKAKEKYKYTEEDMRKAISETRKGMLYNKQYEDEYIQSLSQPKIPVGFECEIEHFYMSSKYFYKDADWVKCDKAQYESIREAIPTCPLRKEHKETTNSQGHTQWVGKYIY